MKPVPNLLRSGQLICPVSKTCRNQHNWPLGGKCIHYLPHYKTTSCQAGRCGVELKEECFPIEGENETSI